MSAFPAVVIKKLRSAIRLSASPAEFACRLGRNLRAARLTLANGRPFVYRAAGGHSLACIPDSYSSAQLYLDGGRHEDEEFQVCKAWISPGDQVVDVGGNIGISPAIFSAVVGDRGRVIAVEPSPTTLPVLRQAAELLGLKQVSIEACCLSSHPGVTKFRAVENSGCDGEGLQSICPGAPADGFKVVEVPATTLDLLKEKCGLDEGRLSCVKIDVEGAEPLVLAGATGVLNSEDPPLLMVEVHLSSLPMFGFEAKDIWQYFPSDRFDLYRVYRGPHDPSGRFVLGVMEHVKDPAAEPWPKISNLLAIPKVGRHAPRIEKIRHLLT